MANLIDFDDPQPKSHNSLPCASNELFGVIKRECFAVKVAGMDDGIGEKLEPGVLIQIVSNYRGDQCHFKIRNFSNWQDNYKTMIYKCRKDDFIVVTGELLPYLLALKNGEGRVELVQNVYNSKFDLEVLKLGSEIRIRGPPGSVEKYYEFRVAYIGVVKKIGRGHYIGLQFKNDDIVFLDLKCLARYRSGSTTGIVVSLDWIMLNLYKEGEYKYEPLTPLNKVVSDSEMMIIEPAKEVKKYNSENFERRLPIIEQRKKTNETGVLPKMRNSSPNYVTKIERNKYKELFDGVKKAENFVTPIHPIKGHPMKSFETGATSKPLTTTSNFDELNKMLKEMELEPNYGSRNVENNYLRRIPKIVHPTKIEAGAMSTLRDQPVDGYKIEFNNNAEIERNKEVYNRRIKTAGTFTSTRLINRQSMKSSETDSTSEIGSTLRQRDQPPQTSCDTPIAYGEIIKNSLGITKMELNDGTKNVENNYARTSQIILQPNKTIETDAMSTKNQHSPEKRKTKFNNNAVGSKQMNPNDPMKNAENNYERTSPTTEIGIMPRQHHQPPENPSHTTSNYVAELELINNLDGAVRNVEKTECDLCSLTVEIGHGIILRECLHSFCVRCITIHVTSNVNYSGIRCPYKKDYECEFDLQDAEIKNLGGEIIYNKILENRLKEYVGTEPNARKCPNKACGNVWVSILKHQNYERCPKCNANWCFICESSHEPKDSHGNKVGKSTFVHNYVRTSQVILQPNKIIETGAMSTRNQHSPENRKTEFNNNAVGSKQMNPNDPMKNAENNYGRASPTTEIGIMPRQHHQPPENPSHTTSNYVAELELINNLDGAVRNVEKTECDLCSLTVKIGHGIILRECLHSFCMRCITIHVTSNVNYSGIRCPYKKDYECEFDLQDAEIKNLGGEIIYNRILENRLKEYVGTEPNARKCPNKACGNVWVSILKHQNYERCPKCNANWCFICKSSHEPKDSHGNKFGKPTFVNNYVRTPRVILQPNKTIETGAMATRNQHSPENRKTEFNNNAVGSKQMNSNDPMKNAENNYERASPTTEIGIVPRQHHQPPENPSHTTSNYVAELELINNLDGAVRNVEKTECDLCSLTVKIGHGIILRECLHSFCMRCITIHVTSNVNYSGIRCPYKKDYECEFDLQDAEIKNLGGEIIYNKILENRLKEYVGTEPNARKCPNKACGNVWVSILKHQNYKRCPKCNANWCFICESSHEPKDSHGNKVGKSTFVHNYVRTSQVILQPNKIIETGAMSTRNQHSPENRKTEFNNNAVGSKQMNPNDPMKNAENNYGRASPTTEIGIMPRQHHQPPENPSHTTSNYVAELELINNLDGAVRNVEKTECDLCSLTVKIGHGIILRECLHSFCMRCITIHVTSNVNYSGIRCPYKKDYECEFDLQDAEIKNLGGEIIYNRILENRLKEYVGTEPNARKCPNKACGNVWVSILKHQNYERCPKCNANWCFICKSSHEPKDSHGNKFGKPTFVNNYVRTPRVILQPNKTIETGAMSTRNQHSPENRKTEFNNNAVGSKQMNSNDPMKNAENNYERASPTTEIGIVPRQHHQPPENPSHTTSNYVAELELINNLDGAVRNVEKTECDLCSLTVKIGHGIILRECLHSFCMRCITIHVTSNVNYSGIRCPYKKDYECEFDLQDAEIKNLGGEIIYNKILENRLKEYVGTEPNARKCPNKACGNVWVSIRKHQNYERCPKCNTNWCFICESSHEPEEGHGNKFGEPIFVNKVLNMFWVDPPEPTVACAKCHKTNILATEYVRLKNCNHTICKNCILPMIKSQTSGSRRAQCVVCNSYLEDMEVAKIAGLEVLNLFLGNRKIQIQNDSAVLQEMCVCGPSVSNCSVVLKCMHTFCRTYIVSLVQEQFSSNHRAACPRCLQEIDKSQIRRIAPGLIKDEIIEKCEICSNPVDVHLAICKHGFCHKCVHIMIMKHVYDPSKKNVICTICQNPITSRDVSNYGGDKIFAQYQSKFEVSKLIPKSVSPKEMCVCRLPNLNCGFILQCGHTFCRTYIADIVIKQLNNKGSATCPKCYLEIDKIEIGYLVPGQIKNEAVNKCQNCSNQAGVHLTNCQHRFCLKCLQNIITTQVFDPKKLFVTCTSCDENVTDREISTYGSEELFTRYKTKFGETPKPVDHITLNEKPFVCDMCEKQISIKGGIILAGCSHWVCIECCKKSIDLQLSIPKQPVCSVCLRELAQYEVEALIEKPTQIS